MMKSVQRYDNMQLDYYIGDMEEGVALASAHQDNNYFAILSRAGTAEMIKKIRIFLSLI